MTLVGSHVSSTTPKGRTRMKVATYTRISTDEERQPFSLEAQTDRLSAYISSQDGWRLVASFTDQLSGKTLNRPGLQQALAEARLGRFDLLLVYRVDRLSRSVRGLAQILEDLEAAGVSFRSATEPFDTTTGRTDDGPAPRGLRRVRAGVDRGAHGGRAPEEGLPGRVDRRPDPVRIHLRPRASSPGAPRRRGRRGPADLRPLRVAPTRISGHLLVAERPWRADQARRVLDSSKSHRRPPEPHVHRAAAVQGRELRGEPRAHHRRPALRGRSVCSPRTGRELPPPPGEPHRLPADQQAPMHPVRPRVRGHGLARQGRHLPLLQLLHASAARYGPMRAGEDPCGPARGWDRLVPPRRAFGHRRLARSEGRCQKGVVQAAPRQTPRARGGRAEAAGGSRDGGTLPTSLRVPADVGGPLRKAPGAAPARHRLSGGVPRPPTERS